MIGPEVGIGLIGIGRHGSRYLQHLLRDVPGAKLVAVCRRRVEERSGVGSAQVYGDFRALVGDPRVQAIVVVTPPALCHDICLAAVGAGKPILIEKPLATTGREARAMVAAAERAGVMMMTAQTLRFDPAIVLLKEQMAAIGRLKSASFTSHIETKAGLLAYTPQPVKLGALLEIGVHLLDLARFLTGEEMAEARCVLLPLAQAPETAATAQLKTVSGVVCTLDVARVDAVRVGTATVVGLKGTVRADWPRRCVTAFTGGDAPVEWTVEPRPTVLAVLQAFLEAIQTGTRPPVTGVDGCRAVELADVCYRSAELGGGWIPVPSPG